MTTKQNQTESKKVNSNPEPDVMHQVPLEEIYLTIAEMIKQSRGTIMTVTEIKIRGDNLRITGNSKTK